MNDNIENIDIKNIFNVEEENFSTQVIAASKEKLILVDFWAPWCGPCKQLTPVLEEIIESAENKVLLAKVNIDENQQIASHLQIQSIPTVMAFKDLKIVNAFQGALPKKKIIEFIEKILGDKINNDNTEFYEEINDLMSNNHFEDALSQLDEYIANNSEDTKAIGMYLRCLTNMKRIDEAIDFKTSLSQNVLKDPEIISALENLNIKQQSLQGPSLNDLENTFYKNSKNLSSLINLSEKYFAQDQVDKACELLIDNFIKFKNKDRDKIKAKILKYFTILGINNEKTKHYRKKLSRLMFS